VGSEAGGDSRSVICGSGARGGSCGFHTPSSEGSRFWGEAAWVIQGFEVSLWVGASLERAAAGLAVEVVDGRPCLFGVLCFIFQSSLPSEPALFGVLCFIFQSSLPSKPALFGVLCFIFRSRHSVPVLCLLVLGAGVSRASNEAAVVLVVTQPVPELGENLVGPCSTSAHPPTRVMRPPGPELVKTTRQAFEAPAPAEPPSQGGGSHPGMCLRMSPQDGCSPSAVEVLVSRSEA